MADLEEFEHTLTKKAGPLPVWAWGVAIGGVAVVFMWLHNRSANTVAPATTVGTSADDAMDSNDDALTGTSGLDGSYTGNDTGDQYSGGDGADYGDDGTDYGVDDTDNGVATGSGDLGADQAKTRKGKHKDATAANAKSGKSNGQWARKVQRFLLAKGHNPFAVQRAVTAYRNGQPLSQAQRRLVSQGIKHVGFAPHDIKQVKPPTTKANTSQTHTSVSAQEHKQTEPHTSNAGAGGGTNRNPPPRQVVVHSTNNTSVKAQVAAGRRKGR